MNNKAPLSVSSFIESPPNHGHQSLCFPSSQKQQRMGLCGCQRSTKSHCISATGVIILVLAYTAMGSILFVTLEGDEDDSQTIETSVAASKPYTRRDIANADIRSRTVDRLWSITEDLNILYKENWTRLASQEVQHFQETIIRAMRNQNTKPSEATNVVKNTISSNKWTYASAFLYSLTLITTIGYGGVAPRTQWGRIAALVYALFGIPLILLYLSSVGEGLSSGIRCIFRRLRSNSNSKYSNNKIPLSVASIDSNEKRPNNYDSGSYCNKSGNGSSNGGGDYLTKSSFHHYHHQCHSPTIPISMCVLFLLCYIALGSFLFHKIQHWSLLESLYFCFSSLGTIGFGDLTPKGYFAQYMASGYILVGMAVVAMCFSLIQTEIILWLRKFGVQDSVIASPINEASLLSVKSISHTQKS